LQKMVLKPLYIELPLDIEQLRKFVVQSLLLKRQV